MAYVVSQTLQTRDSSLGDGLSYSFLNISLSMHTYSQGGYSLLFYTGDPCKYLGSEILQENHIWSL